MPAVIAAAGSEKRLRQACAELDRALRAGERCRAEQFFAAAPLLACHEDWAVELIYTEFAAREELGQRPTTEEFYARFPHWRPRLQRQFQIHQLLRDNLAPAVEPNPRGPAEAALPSRLGPYEVLEELARGGCGLVYKAWQQGLDRVVAVKVLRPEYSRLLRARQRFCHEARVMAALRHRHIMPVHDIGESQGLIFFSMDFAPGSLARHTPAGDVLAAVALLETVARAVHHAHRHGVIHCDLKPSNILLDESGAPLISDFGLARLPTSTDREDADEVMGTPAYMAPEQLGVLGSRGIGPATDVWALGVILYELLSGRRPFTADTLADLQEVVCDAEAAPLPRQVLAQHAPLAAICWRCLARDPGRRYPAAEQLADDLRHYRAQVGAVSG